MNQYTIQKSTLKGTITLPSSKSHTLRAILFASLAKGVSTIHHFLQSPDAFAMIDACRLLGADIEQSGGRLIIRGIDGALTQCEDVINAGNSGIVLRFCTALGMLAAKPIVVTGDWSIRHQRPMKPLLEALCQMGVRAESMREDGYAPIIIRGPRKRGYARLQGQDSQPVSALLIASAFADGPTEIAVDSPGEEPWIDLTLHWFDKLGISYTNQSYTRYHVAGKGCPQGFEYRVCGDLSSCAFPVAAALITGSELVIENVDMDDLQGDKELIFLFQKMGGKIESDTVKKRLYVHRCSTLTGIDVDMNRCIDGITCLAALACFAEGTTRIYNASIAKTKECNRIACVAKELRKMGARIEETEDGLIIERSKLHGAHVDSHHDHRLCMSLAIGAMGAEGTTVVGPTACVAKTYPTFLRDFQALGATIR